MKTYGGVDVEIHVFLISALVGVGWSTSGPDQLTLGERAPDAHWIGRWVGPRIGLDDVENILDLTVTRTPIPRPSSP
jgi:hypothetical protein